MASIKSQLTLNDGMSGVLRKITAALDTTLHSFEQVQRASERAIDKESIDQARAALVGANKELDSMESNFRQAAEQEEQLNRGIRAGSSSMGSMLSKAKRVVATLASAVGVTKLLNLSDQMSGTSARLSFIVDDGGSVEQLERQIMASAQRSRASYLDVADSVAKLGMTAGKAFSGTDEIIAFTELMNKNFAIGGASTAEQASAMYQLTQAMSSGRLQGDEYKSIIENAPLLARSIEDYMRNVNGATGSMKEWASEGELTADVIKNALFSSADEIESRFSTLPLKWSQIWTNMQNRALSAMTPILDKLNGIANSSQFQTVTDGMINGFAAAMYAASSLLDIIINIGSFMVNNWSWISPIVWGLVAAFVAYNAVALITSAINGIVAMSTAAKAAADMMSAGATFTAAAAQHGFNAALFACPITWVVIGVIAFVVALMALCGWIAKTTGLAVTGFGIICGGINVAVQAVWNAFLVVANVALGIWNAFSAVCTNLQIAFHNAISNVKGWFFGLMSTAMTVIEGICAALNKLPFVEFDYSGISAKADEYAAKSAAAYGDVESYTSIADAFSEGFNTYDAFADGWAADAFSAGASWGDGIAGKIGSALDFDLGALGLGAESGSGAGLGGLDLSGLGGGLGDSLGGINDALGGIGDSAGKTAGNTGSMAEALDVSSEQLEYLRDIAERDAINRFTTAEVKIDMTGMTNRIDGSMDLDGVLNTLTEGFAAALATAAEGVHA